MLVPVLVLALAPVAAAGVACRRTPTGGRALRRTLSRRAGDRRAGVRDVHTAALLEQSKRLGTNKTLAEHNCFLNPLPHRGYYL